MVVSAVTEQCGARFRFNGQGIKPEYPENSLTKTAIYPIYHELVRILVDVSYNSG